MKKLFSCFHFFSIFLLLFTIGCVSPVEPEFDFQEGLVFIDAFVATVPGASFVKLRESKVDGFKYSTELIENANVTFINTVTGAEVKLNQDVDSYIPSPSFSASIGETWQLSIVLSDGTNYNSSPETIGEPVNIDEMKVDFDPQFVFRDNSEEFVPGHSVSVSFQDPPDVENFYFWRFTSYETLVVCAQCTNGAFRDGACMEIPNEIDPKPYFTYLCNDDCWRIRFNENIKVFSDEFSNGEAINSLPIADVLLYSKEDIVVEVQQFSLSASAYNYYRVLEDIVENNGSFNAPPPAALIGNLFNPDNDQEYVLGRFTAAAASTETIFIDRTEISENMIDDEVLRMFEFSPNPLIEAVITTECKESRLSTGIEPVGWIDN